MANQTLIQSSHPDHAVARIPDAADVGGSAGIAAQLRRSIVEGVYGFSDRLPAERHLAETFDVSRGTIREALRRLEDDKSTEAASSQSLPPTDPGAASELRNRILAKEAAAHHASENEFTDPPASNQRLFLFALVAVLLVGLGVGVYSTLSSEPESPTSSVASTDVAARENPPPRPAPPVPVAAAAPAPPGPFANWGCRRESPPGRFSFPSTFRNVCTCPLYSSPSPRDRG